ncbi:MAG TPA: hypothetical protein VNK49_00130 [Anaerolineales bacterium]|nr:hypothetical protein [Anaerolineales bacterium]
MPVRSLALLDLPSLYGFRDQAVGLDATRTLTRGNPLRAIGLFSYVNPARHIYSALANGDGETIFGGVTHSSEDTFAKLLYLAPSSHLNHPELPDLIENLSAQAGAWGAFHILAEVEEMSEAFTALRRSGFSVYAWQRMWDVSKIMQSGLDSGTERRNKTKFDAWLRVRSIHIPAVQSLYYQIVPPLLQPVEPLPKKPLGWMCNDGALCYISVAHGVYGIVLTPLIHPEAKDVGANLASLIGNLPDRKHRPVYMCVRSYQAWLEPVLEDLGAQAAERQAVMVKHLARLVKDAVVARATQPSGVSVQPSRVSQIREKK